MKPQILFCDIYKKFIDACNLKIKDNDHLLEHYTFATYFGDIRDIKAPYGAYISPANSFGSMGGGIDEIYSRDMFSGIEKVVMAKIAKRTTRGELSRSFDQLTKDIDKPLLPIGEAIITPLTDYPRFDTCYLITAPTMVTPMDIQGTDNAYKAFVACLKVLKANPQIKFLVCPGLGTGVGGISAEESARQIFRALNDVK